MEYDQSEYEIIKTIGTGSYGRVKLVKKKKEKSYYAQKTLKKYDIIKLNQIEHIYSEYILLKELDHPFIVSLKYLILG
jgi:serine/threonine protein kinase